MNLIKIVSTIFIFLHIQFHTYGIDSIDNNKTSIYFLDSSNIFKYDLVSLNFEKKVTIFNDSLFIRSFYKKYNSTQYINFKKVKRRLEIANYFNLTHFEDKIFITARFLSLDSLNNGWEYLIIEYNKDLRFKNFYILKNHIDYRYGYVAPYFRFKLLINKKKEVMLPSIDPPSAKNLKDSEYVFAIFRLDEKKNEIQFKNNIAAPRTFPKMNYNIYFNYPFSFLSYPINIPLNFSKNPSYFSFPFVVVRNMNGKNTFDPFNHIKLYKDSSKYLDRNYSNYPLGYFFNTLNTRELILAYSYNLDTLKFILRNYQDDKNKLVVMSIAKNKYQINKLLTSTDDLDNSYFHFISDKIIEIRKVKNDYTIKYLK